MTETKTANDYEGVPVWILVIEILEQENADPMAKAIARKIAISAMKGQHLFKEPPFTSSRIGQHDER